MCKENSQGFVRSEFDVYLSWVEDEGLGVFTSGSKFLRNLYQRGSFWDSSCDYVMQNARKKKKNSIKWGSTNQIDVKFCVKKIVRVFVKMRSLLTSILCTFRDRNFLKKNSKINILAHKTFVLIRTFEPWSSSLHNTILHKNMYVLKFSHTYLYKVLIRKIVMILDFLKKSKIFFKFVHFPIWILERFLWNFPGSWNG